MVRTGRWRASAVRTRLAVVALVVLAGSAAVLVGGRALDAEGRMCTLAGSIGQPTFATPEEAFAHWWSQQDPDPLRFQVTSDPANLPEAPTADDFVRDGRNYRWYGNEGSWIQVNIDHPRAYGEVTSDEWTVTGANRCSPV
jgi:hypothetical protein